MEPFYKKRGIIIYKGDCLKLLRELSNEYIFKILLTDPPYGLGNSWKRTSFGTNGKSRLWNGTVPQWDIETHQEVFNVLKKLAPHSIIWGGNNYETPKSGKWLIWDKKQKTTRAECEMAWTNLNGGHKIFRMSRIDAYVNKAEFKKVHPTEKPIQLLRWCIEQVNKEGLIIDPFMGVGTTLFAAASLGREAVGIELDESYCNEAVRRLEILWNFNKREAI